MSPLYLPLFLSAALTCQQARRDWIDPAILDEFPPEEVWRVLTDSTAVALKHATAQLQWRPDRAADWWLIREELERINACYDKLFWARHFRKYGSTYGNRDLNLQEKLHELRHLLGPHLWANRRLPHPIPTPWLCLFREMILPAPELLPPPMPGVP